MASSLGLVSTVLRITAAMVVAGVLLIGAAPATAQDAQQDAAASPEERSKVRVFEALDLMDAGSYGEARLMLQLALGLNAELDRAWYYLAQCNVQLNNWSEALEALSKYEAANLSEHERMQIADLRSKIQGQQAAEKDDNDWAEAEGELGTDGENPSTMQAAAPRATASVDGRAAGTAETTAAAEKAAPTSKESPSEVGTDAENPSTMQAAAPRASATVDGRTVMARVGPAVLVAGGIVAGIGIGFMARGLVMSGDSATHAEGKKPFEAGRGILIGGGLALAVGIPITAIGNKKKASIVISYQPEAVQPRTSVYLVGRW